MFWALKQVSHTYLHTPTLILCITSIFFFDVLIIFCTFWYQNVQDMDFIFNSLMRNSCYYLPISHNGTSNHVECRNQPDPGQGLKLTKLLTVKNGF